MRTTVCAALAACLLSATAAGAGPVTMHRPAASQPLSMVYDLYLGGIRIGELSVDARVDGQRYRAASAMRTAGVVGALYAAGYSARTEGRIADGLLPERFEAEGHAGGDVQGVEMRYAGRQPVEVLADPPFKPKPWEIEPRAQGGTLDPVTAALSALAPMPVAALCNRSVEIYDGRRRYALDLGRPVADGERIRCEGLYRRVAGYKPKELKETIAFDLWFEERADGLAHLVRAAGDSGFGLAVALLRQ